MNDPKVLFSTFTIEREYPHKAEKVFSAFSDIKKKRRWFAEGEGFVLDSYDLDFRVLGMETCAFRFGEMRGRNDTQFHDIVPNQRIVAAYTMTINDSRISSSLATTEFVPTAKGTKVIYTEQGAFFDGKDNPAQREGGCRELFEALAKELDRN